MRRREGAVMGPYLHARDVFILALAIFRTMSRFLYGTGVSGQNENL